MTPRQDVSRSTTLAMVGAALAVLGGPLPWSATARRSFSGFEHVDGFVTFGIAVAVGTLALSLLAVDGQGDWRGRVVACLGGLAIVGLAVKWYLGIFGTTGSVPRAGLHFTLLGGFALVAGSIAGLRSAIDGRDRLAAGDGAAGPEGEDA